MILSVIQKHNKFFNTPRLILGALAILASSPSTFAYEEIESGKITVSVTNRETRFNNLDLSAKLYDVQTFERPVLKENQWTEWECDYVPGDGKGDWKGFYSVPKFEKARALSSAIKGIGISTAEQIVDSGRHYFEPKPRNWNAFKDEIRQIERELDLKGLYGNVISRYGDENMSNLGYRGSSESCRLVVHNEPYWTTESYTERRFIRTLPRVIDIRVEGAKLLNGEQDQIQIVFDGRDVKFGFPMAHNDYSAVEEARGVFVVSARSRIPVRPATSDFNISLTKEGTLYLNVTDLRAEELARVSEGYKLNISFTLKKKKGMCSKDEVIVQSTELVPDGSARIDLQSLAQKAGKNVESGAKYYVKDITIERLQTEFFSGKSGELKTSEINY